MLIAALVGAVLLALMIWAVVNTNKKTARARQVDLARNLAARHVQIIEESKVLINKSKNLDTIASRFDVILENADKLADLAIKFNYPSISNPPPGVVKKFYLEERERFISGFVVEQVNDSIEKAKTVSRKSSKIALLDKALLAIHEGKKAIRDDALEAPLQEKEKEIRSLINAINSGEAE